MTFDIDALERELVAQYSARPETIGMLRIGSSTRPWADAMSDLDVIVVVDDVAFRELTLRDRHAIGIDRGPPRRKTYDLMVRSWSQLAGYVDSTWDLRHHQYKYARVLFDPTGRVAELLVRIIELPEAVRQARLRVHFHEAVMFRRKAEKSAQRGNHGNAALTAMLALYALSRLVCVAQGEWASLQDWTTNNLRDIQIPEPIVAELERGLLAPSTAAIDALLALVVPWLDTKGLTFQHEPIVINEWAIYSDEGIAAKDQWSAIRW